MGKWLIGSFIMKRSILQCWNPLINVVHQSGIIEHYAHHDMMDCEAHSTTYELFLPKRPYQGVRSNFQNTGHLEAKETS